MGNILSHCESSARLFGGVPEDYIPIHKFLDCSKLFLSDWRHRALLHNTLGVHLCEIIFGDFYKLASSEKNVCTRTVAEQHIKEDLNFLPTPGDFISEMPIRRWMAGATAAQVEAIRNRSVPEDLEFGPSLKQALQEIAKQTKERRSKE